MLQWWHIVVMCTSITYLDFLVIWQIIPCLFGDMANYTGVIFSSN